MWMGGEKIPKKMLHTKRKKTKRETQNQIDRPNQKGCRNERGKSGRSTRKQEVGKQRRLEISL